MTTNATTVILTAALALASRAAFAQATPPASDTSLEFLNRPGWSGIGVNIGNIETGVTGKVWLSRKLALQGALGGRPDGNSVRFNFDLTSVLYQWRPVDEKYAVLLYFGVGGALGHDFGGGARSSSTEGGLRVPLGTSILIADNPLELYFEVAPELTARDSPAPGRYAVYADGTIGLRWYL